MPDLTPADAATWFAHAGMPLPEDRHAEVAALASRMNDLAAGLRELDLGDVEPYRPGGADAAR
ncbi:hypothetical protein JOD54_004603 [Actinokineospora baliensis]|uniref:hypothetical protein n=1 Tax=Actinokineospora baliensis TaxID=547056 RepID=UPI001959E698|nr:hypothetical protein [Actinokineospora baliensis]MBM7774399.1 hypothetical protein [Actinokineospora baliensis]